MTSRPAPLRCHGAIHGGKVGVGVFCSWRRVQTALRRTQDKFGSGRRGEEKASMEEEKRRRRKAFNCGRRKCRKKEEEEEEREERDVVSPHSLRFHLSCGVPPLSGLSGGGNGDCQRGRKEQEERSEPGEEGATTTAAAATAASATTAHRASGFAQSTSAHQSHHS